MSGLNKENQTHSSRLVVLEFFSKVRSGLIPEAADQYMHKKVKAHQMVSGLNQTVVRTPKEYSEHIIEFLSAYGPFKLEIQEVLSEGNKVYVRWQQTGKHLQTNMGYLPTGQKLITVGSAVYRVELSKIAEYWIQQENFGLLQQLESYS